MSYVLRGAHKITGQQVAIKKIKKTKLDSKMRAQIYSEAKILYKCSHEIIIKCVEVFESTGHIYMVTEFC